jgi:hypothetical protein
MKSFLSLDAISFDCERVRARTHSYPTRMDHRRGRALGASGSLGRPRQVEVPAGAAAVSSCDWLAGGGHRRPTEIRVASDPPAARGELHAAGEARRAGRHLVLLVDGTDSCVPSCAFQSSFVSLFK